MNHKILKVVFAFFAVQLTACSTTNNINTFTPPAADPDQSVIYIYRPAEMANALYSPGLNIDGEFKLYIKNGLNSRLSLSPGTYKLEFQAEKDYSSLTPLSLTLTPGTISYVRVTTSLKVKNTVAYEPYKRSFQLTQVDESTAMKEIAECCTDNNTSPADDSDKKSAVQEPKDGFSVDKTQNPFSH